MGRVLAEYEHHMEVRRAKEAGDEEVAQSELEYTALRLDIEEMRLARQEVDED